MSVGVAYVANDNLIWVRGAERARDGTLVTAGIGALTTIKDVNGEEITGQDFPTILFYTGADGDWVAQLDDAAVLTANGLYTAVIDLDGGDDLKGHWEVPFLARVRQG